MAKDFYIRLTNNTEIYGSAEESSTLSDVGRVDFNKFNDDNNQIPLTFEILSGGSLSWVNSFNLQPEKGNETLLKASNPNALEIQFSLNGGVWTTVAASDILNGGTLIATLKTGDIISFRGDNDVYYYGGNIYGRFYAPTVVYNVKGNIMSMFNSTGYVNDTEMYYQTGSSDVARYTGALFYGSQIISAENLVLPAVESYQNYAELFANCSSLQYISYPANIITNDIISINNWTYGVAANGTMKVYGCDTNWYYDSSNSIPSGWTVVDKDGNDITSCFNGIPVE